MMIGPVRALARLVAVSRLAAPATNPEPRFRKIILLSAAPTKAPPEARPVFLIAWPAHHDLINLFWLVKKWDGGPKIIIQIILGPNFTRCSTFNSHKSG